MAGTFDRTDLTYARQAANNGWPTPPERRRELVAEVRRLLSDTGTPRSLRRSAKIAARAFVRAGWAEDLPV